MKRKKLYTSLCDLVSEPMRKNGINYQLLTHIFEELVQNFKEIIEEKAMQ